jgi:putative acetyltransferase
MKIRKATDQDAQQIVRIFHETVHTVNLGDYTQEQVDAWSPEMPTPSDWIADHLRTRTTFVADDNGQLAGFGELLPDGHVDCFYCHHQCQRQGVGSTILRHIEQEAVSTGLNGLFTEASITAKPFFEAHGFTVVKQQTVTRQGVDMTNYVMEKQLEANKTDS